MSFKKITKYDDLDKREKPKIMFSILEDDSTEGQFEKERC